MTQTFDAADIKRLATEVLDQAYFRLAKGEPLTPEEDAALAIAKPSQRDLESRVEISRSILEHQKNAGTAAERAAAQEHREQAEAEAKQLRGEIAEERRKLKAREEAIEAKVNDAVARVRRMETSAECLRDFAPEHITQQLGRDHYMEKRPLLVEHDELTRSIEFCDQIAELQPDTQDLPAAVSINKPAREILGMPVEVITTDCRMPQPATHVKPAVKGQIVTRVSPTGLKQAKRLAEEKRPAFEKRLDEVDAALAKFGEIESQVREYYVPQ
ncbi:hypothetical protein U8335_19590 [Roseiconus lacunae]|uniref:hypothetical protein n=1 Tax=Roseiconus lacunae TaxID=2605694 RepID=UPI00308F04A7|nr:hypothetical protein U8335_19590 [Stieleria sp. HD01]